jgi:hypothetical protein
VGNGAVMDRGRGGCGPVRLRGRPLRRLVRVSHGNPNVVPPAPLPAMSSVNDPSASLMAPRAASAVSDGEPAALDSVRGWVIRCR